jgi:Tfp pilus assembly PilM family ATPase
MNRLFSSLKNAYSKKTLGLDVRAEGVFLAQLKRVKSKEMLAQLAFRPLQPAAVLEGKIQDFQGLRLILQELVSTLRLEKNLVTLLLPAHLVRLQIMQVPQDLTTTELCREINLQLSRDLPGLEDALCMDYAEIKEQSKNANLSPHPAYTTIIYAVTRKAYLKEYQACVEAAGLKVEAIEIDHYALWRVIDQEEWRFLLAQSLKGMLHISQKAASFSVLKGEEMIFYQQWQRGEAEALLKECLAGLQLFSSIYSELKLSQLAVCGSAADVHLVQDAKELAHYSIYPATGSAHLALDSNKLLSACAPIFADSHAQLYPTDFFYALGAALQAERKC